MTYLDIRWDTGVQRAVTGAEGLFSRDQSAAGQRGRNGSKASRSACGRKAQDNQLGLGAERLGPAHYGTVYQRARNGGTHNVTPEVLSDASEAKCTTSSSGVRYAGGETHARLSDASEAKCTIGLVGDRRIAEHDSIVIE
jgi:hypothetical protein